MDKQAGRAVNLLHVPRAVACPDKFRGTLSRDRSRRRDRRRARAVGVRRRRPSSRSPTVAKAPSTRCSPHAAVRGAPRASPVRSATRSTRSGAVLPGRDRGRSRWRAPAGSHWSAAPTIRCARRTRGTGELIAVARREGFSKVIVAVGGSATTDGGLAAVDALGWSLQGLDVTVACDVDDACSSTPRPSTDRRRARAARRSRCSTRRLELLARAVPDAHGRRRHDARRRRRGRRARGRARRDRRAPRARLRCRRRGASSSNARSRVRCSRSPAKGKLDASSLEGKVVGGVLDWAEEFAVPNVCVIAGQVVDDAREGARGATRCRVSSR